MLSRKTFLVYFLSGSLILGWWALAFKHSFQSNLIESKQISKPLPDKINEIKLSKLSRHQLQQALSGNFTLMARLIHGWEMDACLLESQGVKATHLSLKEFLLSQQLAKQIRQQTKILKKKYLPQTYVSASVLLALLPPEQIAALPKGLKEDSELYPEELTSQVSLTIDRFHTEELFQAKPKAAFVSLFYSHPAMLETLMKQNIKLIPLDNSITLNAILKTVQLLGREVDRSKEAQLLSLFIKASFLAIDNRLTLQKPNLDTQKTLYVHHYSRYYLPSPSTITWELLGRVGLQPKDHSIPLSCEHLRAMHPDTLIISTDQEHSLAYPISQIDASVIYVQDKIQQSPTQYIVLAYYDLVQSIMQKQSL